MDECQVTLTGYVATQPQTKTFKSGASNVSMRVAWTERRRDRVTGEWMDGDTSYLSVYCWRKIGTNVALSLRTGDPVLVKGKLTVRTYEGREGSRRTAVEVDASSIGHDLSRGVSKFLRVRPETGMTAAEYDAAREAEQITAAAGNGSGPAAVQDRSGSGSGDMAGDGRPLRFSGGLESDLAGRLESGQEDGLAGVPELADDGPGADDWAGDIDRADPDGGSSDASVGDDDVDAASEAAAAAH